MLDIFQQPQVRHGNKPPVNNANFPLRIALCGCAAQNVSTTVEIICQVLSNSNNNLHRNVNVVDKLAIDPSTYTHRIFRSGMGGPGFVGAWMALGMSNSSRMSSAKKHACLIKSGFFSCF